MIDGSIRLAFVLSTYYPGYSMMLDAALAETERQNAQVSFISKVPGCFDMALPVQALLQRDDVDAVVALGVILPVPDKASATDTLRDVITDWDETIAHGTIASLDKLSLAFGKPVVKELIGPGFPVGRVKECVELYARAGVQAAVALVRELERIRTAPAFCPQTEEAPPG